MMLGWDRQVKHYVCFLFTLFVLGLGAAGAFCAFQSFETTELYATRNVAIASALLEQGVDTTTIALALTSTEASPDGAALLSALGMGADAPPFLLPDVLQFQRKIVSFVYIAVIAGFVLLFWGTFRFLHQRNQLYRNTSAIIQRYSCGEYSCHLPQNQEGTLDQMFAAIEQLATMLAAKSETERHTRQFLKNTISDISHQLKTPLAALMMYQEIIAEEPENADAVRNFAQKMGMSLERIEGLIQAMLKITRLDTGNIPFEKENHVVRDVISHAIGDLTVRAAQENKVLAVEGDTGQVVCCDLEWTSEAIGNVVKNALDHTKPQDTIRIICQPSPVGLRMLIEDNGAGIASDDLYHIFKRFYRSKHSAKTAGIGLGLPLAKAILDGQGASISVQSELGQGTRFTIVFLTKL